MKTTINLAQDCEVLPQKLGRMRILQILGIKNINTFREAVEDELINSLPSTDMRIKALEIAMTRRL